MPKPKSSEWGKLSAGQAYIFWATDFARAVFSIGLGENVGMLFWHVVEESWGTIRDKRRGEWPDPQPVVIGYVDLADLWGTTKQRVYDAEKWLVKARMLLKSDEGLWVNKNAHEWVHPVSEVPLVAGKRLAFCCAGRTRKDNSNPESPGNVTTLPIAECESDKVTLQRYQSNVTTLPAVAGAHKGTGAELNLRRGESAQFAGAREEALDEEGEPFNPPGTVAPPPPSDPETDRVAEQCERLFPGNGWSHLARDLCTDHTPAVVSEALRTAAEKRVTSFRFVVKVADRIRSEANGAGPRGGRPARAEPEIPYVQVPPDWEQPKFVMPGKARPQPQPKPKGK